MDEARLVALRERLLELRRQVVAAGDLPIEPAQRDPISRPDDDAAPLAEMEQVIASNRNRERSLGLQRIDDALRRMSDDPAAYGLCEGCDEPIPEGRLVLLPHVRLCAECQTEDEEAHSHERGPGRRHLTDYR